VYDILYISNEKGQ